MRGSWTLFVFWALAAVACGGEDDVDVDAGPALCPTGAPETGTLCPEAVGICTYRGLNRDCPPLVGECRCVQGGWQCDVPECSNCNESCGVDADGLPICCNLDDVCRASPEGLRQECGPEGDGTAAMFEDCGHESDCAGQLPICSPICGSLCCTISCEGEDECAPGTCQNGVCAPQ